MGGSFLTAVQMHPRSALRNIQPNALEARSHLYVDDPALAVRGTQEFWDDVVATTVLIKRLLGFQRAFATAERGTEVRKERARFKILFWSAH